MKYSYVEKVLFLAVVCDAVTESESGGKFARVLWEKSFTTLESSSRKKTACWGQQAAQTKENTGRGTFKSKIGVF